MPPVVERRDLTLEMNAQTQEAKANLEKAGIVVPGRPKGEIPPLPPRVADLSDKSLMESFTLMTRWADYIGGLLALQEVDERYADSQYDFVWARVFSDTLVDAAMVAKARSDASVTKAKADTAMHPDVRAARTVKDNAYARRKVMQLMQANLERDISLLSRELSRRLGRAPAERRADRWSA